MKCFCTYCGKENSADDNYCIWCGKRLEKEAYPEKVSVTGVMLNKSELKFTSIPSSERLVAIVKPDNADNKQVIWTSSAPAVASVDAMGNVCAVNEGSARITVTTVDGNYTAICMVEVKKASVIIKGDSGNESKGNGAGSSVGNDKFIPPNDDDL